MPVMGLPIEPLYALSAVPGDIAGAIAAGGATIIGWLARRNVVVEDRSRTDLMAIYQAQIEYERAAHERAMARRAG